MDALWQGSTFVSIQYPASDVTRWHREMVEVLRALDPHDHLITTSQSQRTLHRGVWNQTGIDFTQIHFYANSFPPQPNLARNVTAWTAERFAATGRPVLFGELGVDSRGPDETRAAGPEGVGIHDGLWAGVVSGGAGTAMSWWWDNLIDLEPERYYPMFGAVARFVRGVALRPRGLRPARRGRRRRDAAGGGVRARRRAQLAGLAQGRRLPVVRAGVGGDDRRDARAALIGNEARTADRILYDGAWMLLLTGHGQAFGTARTLPAHLQARPPSPGPEFRRRLASLDEASLDAALEDLLTPRERKAMLERRNALLAPAAAAAR